MKTHTHKTSESWDVHPLFQKKARESCAQDPAGNRAGDGLHRGACSGDSPVQSEAVRESLDGVAETSDHGCSLQHDTWSQSPLTTPLLGETRSPQVMHGARLAPEVRMVYELLLSHP